MWHDIPGHGEMCDRTPIETAWQRVVQQLDSCPHDDDKIWRMATAKIEDAEPVINFLEPEEFYEHYQNLAPTREEQEQWLAQLNTRLYHHCLISSDFEYCDNCDLIYNPPPHMIYLIPEKEEPISSCASELESLINCDSDSDDNDENTGSSFIQNGNDDKNNSDSDSNPTLNYEQYIALPDLFKEQELK
ncbi:hypothetical protein G9A89_015781 [Geosiphon pyriformis]|nr:hypothetical protein G9A89_015781 [Geosiphon pyriformis]